MSYPPARTSDLVNLYHGVAVADPYRWLEEPDSPETVAWVEAQNTLTRSVLDGSLRDTLVQRLTTLYDYPRTGVPEKRGGRLFFTRNTGLQNQGVLYVQEGRDGDPQVLLDPNTLSADGTVALTAVAVNDAGARIAYGLSRSGSDLQEIAIRDVATGQDLPDRIHWVKFAAIAWVKDGSGFYYTRFPEPGSVPAGDENYFNRLCYHRLGDTQERDVLVFDRPGERETVFDVAVSDSDRWAIVTALQGSSDRSEVYIVDRYAEDLRAIPIVTGFDASYEFIEESGGRLFFKTNAGAPLGRIVSVDPAAPRVPPVEVVPESTDKLSLALLAGRTLVTSYLHNASDRLLLFDVAGHPAGVIDLPEIASIAGISGHPEDDEVFVGVTTFTRPPANLRYELSTGMLETWPPPDESQRSGRHNGDYETTQVWYPSREGTNISMFLVHRRGLEKDGQRPVLLTGYGGFNISLTPAFDPSIFVLLEQGGIHAVANLRGGGEYGEAWHQAGMFERKQTVFDDFIAAAEWLAASGWSNPRRIAIEGGSNGGLLTAAVMLQRPGLFGAVVSRVPVADMLRFHLFTVGRFWISEYGCSEDATQFPYLFAYSPYHNVKDGVACPPILIMTADTDDRVSPGMAKKLAARLQAASPDGAPVLIRVETKAGHGAGKPTGKVIDEDADLLAFIFRALEIAAPPLETPWRSRTVPRAPAAAP